MCPSHQLLKEWNKVKAIDNIISIVFKMSFLELNFVMALRTLCNKSILLIGMIKDTFYNLVDNVQILQVLEGLEFNFKTAFDQQFS